MTDRTIEVIHKEYSELCARAGHLSYQIHIMGKDLQTLNNKLEDLNKEAAALSAAKEDKHE